MNRSDRHSRVSESYEKSDSEQVETVVELGDGDDSVIDVRSVDFEGYKYLEGDARYYRPSYCCQVFSLLMHLVLLPIYLAIFVLAAILALLSAPFVSDFCIKMGLAGDFVSLAFFYAIERQMPMLSRTYSGIPYDIEEITLEYLNSIRKLRERGEIVEIWAKDNPDQGLASFMRFFKLKRSGVPDQKIVIKCGVRTFGMRFEHNLVGLSKSEHDFYTTIKPMLPNIDSPECFLSQYAPTTGQSCLILEQLDGQLFSQAKVNAAANPGDVPTTDQNVRICEVMAELHGTFWGADERPECDGFVDFNHPAFKLYWQTLGPFWPRYTKALEEKKNYKVSPELDRLWALVNLPGVWAALGKRLCRAPITLTHGDAHWGNFFIRNGSDKPGLLDWQLCFKKPPAVDFALTFLSTDRGRGEWIKENEVGMLRDVYLPALHSHCERARSEYTFETAWDDYLLGLIYYLSAFVSKADVWFAQDDVDGDVQALLDMQPVLLDAAIRHDLANYMVDFIQSRDIPISPEHEHLFQKSKPQGGSTPKSA